MLKNYIHTYVVLYTYKQCKIRQKAHRVSKQFKTEDDTLSWQSVNAILHSCKDAGKFTKIRLTTIHYIKDNYGFDYDTKQLLDLILFLCNSLKSKND